MTKFVAEFEPQEWSNDYAWPCGKPVEWDCTPYLEGDGTLYNAVMAGTAGGMLWLDEFDELARDPLAPPTVRDHDGPFTITVRREDIE